MQRASALAVGLSAAVVVAACSPAPTRAPAPTSSGPARVRPAVALRHAEEFERDLPDRRAGSQQEVAASTYLLAHLQQAGYAIRLDAVPVEDLVRSTNVMALPPDGAEPAVVVAIPYDRAPGRGPGGAGLGLFLELARALKRSVPDHDVQFVALGAEGADVGGGQLGSRRLVALLEDEARDPLLIGIGEVSRSGGLEVSGPAAGGLLEVARAERVPAREAGATSSYDAFAGFEHAVVSGGLRAAGRVLLAFLSQS